MSILMSNRTRTSLRLLSVKSKRAVKRKQFYDELYNEANNGSSKNTEKNSSKKIKLDSNSKSNQKKRTSTATIHEKNPPSTAKTTEKKSLPSDDKVEKNLPPKSKIPYRIAKFRDRIEKLKTQKLSSVPDMDPSFFLRCHSDSNQPDDDGNLVWMCRFQPRPFSSKGEPLGTTNLMASCGGKIVCIIDYTSGKVMMRYKDINRDENFYAMAWTTLKVSCNRKKEQQTTQSSDSYFTNILAVAGEAQEVKKKKQQQLNIEMFI